MISFEAYMSQVLGDRWADVPKDVTEYERKVADLASRFQSVESEELRSILDQAGGNFAQAETVLRGVDLQGVLRSQVFGKNQVARLREMPYEESVRAMIELTPAERACTLACMAPLNFILTPQGRSFGADCIFCDEPMMHGELIQELQPCQHQMHAECINKWLVTPAAAKLECPSCRQPFKNRSSALDSMSSEDRAATLAAMPFGDRSHAAEEYGARKVATFIIMKDEQRREKLAALSAVDRAAILAAMSPEDEADALGVMDLSDRATSLAMILQAIHPTSRAARLAIMSPEERAGTLAALSQEERASTLVSMTPQEMESVKAPMLATALLPWLDARNRCDVIFKDESHANEAPIGTPNIPKGHTVKSTLRPGTAEHDAHLFETTLLIPLSSVFELDMFAKGIDDEDSSSESDDFNEDDGMSGMLSGNHFEGWMEEKRQRQKSSTLCSSSGAELLMNIGTTKLKMGDIAGCVEEYMEAKRIWTATGNLQTANAIGVVKWLAANGHT